MYDRSYYSGQITVLSRWNSFHRLIFEGMSSLVEQKCSSLSERAKHSRKSSKDRSESSPNHHCSPV